MDNFWFLYLELNAFFAYSAGASSKTEGYTEYIWIIANFSSKIEIHFFSSRCCPRRCRHCLSSLKISIVFGACKMQRLNQALALPRKQTPE